MRPVPINPNGSRRCSGAVALNDRTVTLSGRTVTLNAVKGLRCEREILSFGLLRTGSYAQNDH